MSSIYIHVPFCKSICYYCDFYKTKSLNYLSDYLIVLCNEIKLQKSFFKHPKITTLYFGGGTPSVLKIEDISLIINKLREYFDLSDLVECTFEMNPDDIEQEYLIQLKNLGFNRLSIGIQSFDNKYLKLMNRRHSSQQAIDCIQLAKSSGFSNISIDLIYGLPNLTLELWKEQLLIAFSLDIQHISAYHLSYEENTVFYKCLKNNRLHVIDENESFLQFQMIHEMAKDYNFTHYEISNFAKNNLVSVHNSNYWNDTKYLGLGPSAHSYNGEKRFSNLPDLKKYTSALLDYKMCNTEEILTENTKFNEYLMTKLRTSKGVNINEISALFSEDLYLRFLQSLRKYSDNEFLVVENQYVRLTLEGWFISDSIISDFMII